jgi:hypothetical protein
LSYKFNIASATLSSNILWSGRMATEILGLYSFCSCTEPASKNKRLQASILFSFSHMHSDAAIFRGYAIAQIWMAHEGHHKCSEKFLRGAQPQYSYLELRWNGTCDAKLRHANSFYPGECPFCILKTCPFKVNTAGATTGGSERY